MKETMDVNPFFDPETFPCEVLGFYEELIWKDARGAYGYKLLGTRKIPKLTRPAGSAGRIDVVVTEPIVLDRGYKTITVRASKNRPLRCFSMLQIICGRLKKKL